MGRHQVGRLVKYSASFRNMQGTVTDTHYLWVTARTLPEEMEEYFRRASMQSFAPQFTVREVSEIRFMPQYAWATLSMRRVTSDYVLVDVEEERG